MELIILRYTGFHRMQKCSVNGKLSCAELLSCGVPQGSILGPLLFLVYMNDLPNCFSNGSARMYADDTNITIARDSFGNLQPLLNNELLNINNWLVANKLSLNVAKTTFMVIGSRQKLLTQANYPLCLSVDNNEVKRVSKSKALGIMTDENLSWNEAH